MALIPCPECNKQVSTSAPQCPHCGYPINPEATSIGQVAPALRNCPDCGGSGKVQQTCKTCDGNERLFCFHCEGKGVEPGEWNVACSQCEGWGGQLCDRCGGSGIDPGMAQCVYCKGGGQVTFEQFEARQTEITAAQAEKEAAALKARELSEAAAAQRFIEEAPMRELAAKRTAKEKNSGAQFAYAAIGGILGLVPALITLVSTAISGGFPDSAVAVLLLAAAGLTVGPAAALQYYYGETKRCLIPAMKGALGASVAGLIAAAIVTLVFIKFEVMVIALLAVVMVVALIAVNRARAA